ncbi:hypothetical protein BV898_16242 [Hypsibius exemplaris]|uniref:G-protein coupled receptors family 1 profile domain-containing protein n=1 Tax=Hypsibius exemplaris TaxID=2072580 RepID=A0A9X6ND69_HYPEX|nr:hypothetical protein BV898_16242 [Hypsibius exemplaris]
MFAAGISDKGPTAIRFVPPRSKVNSDFYMKHVLKPLFKKNIPKLYGKQAKSVALHHDSAAAHTALTTVRFLQDNNYRFISAADWPFNSPDLSPINYSINGIFKKLSTNLGPSPDSVIIQETSNNNGMATVHRDLQNNASLNNSSFTTNYSVPTRGNCTLTSSQLMSLNGLPLILTGIIAAAQLFNLIIFHLWRQKEPFVLFHVALAYYSLFIGILAAGTPIVRMFPWSERVSVPLTITLLNCFEFIRTLSLVTLLCISADRWLSVEFAVKYRAHISKKRVRQVIAVSWFVTAVLDWPGAVLNWPYYQAFCYRPPIDTGSGIGRLVWKIFTGPLIVALLLLCQGRIIFTAVRLKSRQLLSRARTRSIAVAAAPSVHHPMVRIVWSSLRASMVILLAVVISEVPFMVFANGSFGGDSVMSSEDKLLPGDERQPLEFVRTLSLVTLLCISADRWLSVEFAVKYRAHISKERVRQVIAVSWFVTAVLDWPGAVLNWPYYQTFCYRPPIDTGSGIGRLVWKIFTGPLIVALLLLCQGRIIFIAWRGSLRASMVILLAAVISEVPFMVFANGSFGSDSVVVHFIFMLPLLQHIYSPAVYLAFFPQFRAIVCGRRQLPQRAEVGESVSSGQHRNIPRVLHFCVERKSLAMLPL